MILTVVSVGILWIARVPLAAFVAPRDITFPFHVLFELSIAMVPVAVLQFYATHQLAAGRFRACIGFGCLGVVHLLLLTFATPLLSLLPAMMLGNAIAALLIIAIVFLVNKARQRLRPFSLP
jgi:hypothetical protein